MLITGMYMGFKGSHRVIFFIPFIPFIPSVPFIPPRSFPAHTPWPLIPERGSIKAYCFGGGGA